MANFTQRRIHIKLSLKSIVYFFLQLFESITNKSDFILRENETFDKTTTKINSVLFYINHVSG
jgi:hypothetical protein